MLHSPLKNSYVSIETSDCLVGPFWAYRFAKYHGNFFLKLGIVYCIIVLMFYSCYKESDVQSITDK